MKKQIALSLLVCAFALELAPAQSPAPIVVQAANSNAPAPAPTPVATPAVTNDAALKAFEQIKAANEAVLAKQAATLQQLEEMEKAAEQIRIYSKRG